MINPCSQLVSSVCRQSWSNSSVFPNLITRKRTTAYWAKEIVFFFEGIPILLEFPTFFWNFLNSQKLHALYAADEFINCSENLHLSENGISWKIHMARLATFWGDFLWNQLFSFSFPPPTDAFFTQKKGFVFPSLALHLRV